MGKEAMTIQTIEIESPILAELIIHIVNGKVVDSKPTNVNVVEFTTTSLKFLSSLRFPVSENVVYRLRLKMFGTQMEVYGMILTSVQQDQSDHFYYEMNFKVY
ncbi:hypothetical protein [Alkalihalobacterium chitinilyticum]|uniref:Uncharacterized protein n=1 Tax=Alkalihalobacterium chitinilyticum TaxID=2980103 RepID=A0ABT5VE80_9BACI|nr:hypothetical protein [Alkalihalobacterium chitinilyticum]MDE5413771.1 hypothetical protein [Alkalihalobacterium chitinilyticum]